MSVDAGGYAHTVFDAREQGAWIRVTPQQACVQATAFFECRGLDRRPLAPARRAAVGAGGLVWANERKSLFLLEGGVLYELDVNLTLKPIADERTQAWMQANLATPAGVLTEDAASVIYRDEQDRRWRLPKGQAQPEGARVSREVSTERDLFHAHGTFYELPSNNAGGFAVVRPVTTHNLPVRDYCSWRGLTVISGIGNAQLPGGEVVRTSDGKVSLWLGASDDLWQFGKPCGEGGPWRNTDVKAGVPSDPYLLTGYDEKTLRLEHGSPAPLAIRVELDITGAGLWVPYQTFTVAAGRPLEHRFPTGFQAYWLRTVALADTRATAILTYR